MDLLSLLSWAIVEASSPNPNMPQLRAALERALEKAAKLDQSHEQRTQNLIRLAATVGGL